MFIRQSYYPCATRIGKCTRMEMPLDTILGGLEDPQYFPITSMCGKLYRKRTMVVKNLFLILKCLLDRSVILVQLEFGGFVWNLSKVAENLSN